MQLTGKNAEYADFILSKIRDNGGWISKHEILRSLHNTYNYALEPEFVLHDLEDNWKFIIADGVILRSSKEGDKAAKKGSKKYEKGLELKEKTVKLKTYLETIGILVTIIGTLLGLLIARL